MILRKNHLQIAIFCLAALWFLFFDLPPYLKSSGNAISAMDFVPVYSGARCLLHDCNPYHTSDIQAQFLQAGGAVSDIPPGWHDEPPVYPPSTLLLLTPFAPINFPTARLIWMEANALLLVLAAWIAWRYSLPDFSWISLAVAVMFFIVAPRILLHLGNPAAASISFFVIATAFFLKDRHLNWATLALLLSLAIKPQIAGLAALYFLWQRIHRKHVILAMAGSAVLLFAGIGVLQSRPVSQNWLQDWRGNMAGSVMPGAINDPTPSYDGSIYDFHLDAVTSVVFASPATFHKASLAIFLVGFAAWLLIVWRSSRSGQLDHPIAISALSILTLLPVYHRIYDAIMLLVAVLAIPSIFKRSRVLGAAIFLAIYILFSRDYSFFIGSFVPKHMNMALILHDKLLYILLFRTRNLMLLLDLILFLLALTPIFTSRTAQKQLHPTA